MADDGLTQDFDAHVPFAFTPIPETPALANRIARMQRWFFIAFAESWLAVLLFRMKVRFRRADVPVLPSVCDLLSRTMFRVQIGNAVVIGRGLTLTHGNVVIDGRVRIGIDCQINPWVTIGLSNSRKLGFSAEGPTIGDHVHIGTGAKVLGPVTIGDYARIGANAVVLSDVPANATAVGAPARVLMPKREDGPGDNDDARLAIAARRSIVDYRLRRQSLQALLSGLDNTFGGGSRALAATGESLAASIARLQAAASLGSDHAPDLTPTLEGIDAALAPYAGEVQA